MSDSPDSFFSSPLDSMQLIEQAYLISCGWADFHIEIIDPFIEPQTPPVLIKPALIGTDEYEFVYPIHDHGFKMSTSKGEEMFMVGASMCKLFYTIEKIIFLLIERLNANGGIDAETEVQVNVYGHPVALRKAFESIINLSYNVIVANFDPGLWGERFLGIVKNLSERGYGFLPGAPRTNYRQRPTPARRPK